MEQFIASLSNGNIGLTYITWPELLIRVAMTIIFGFILGYERESKSKPIDFRAYMIVALTTCILAILGQELYADFASEDNIVKIDLSTIIAGVMTGIGFLGAGAIIHRGGENVIGTATGASIWASGGIGLTIGFGFYSLAIVVFIAVALTLLIGGILRKNMASKEKNEGSAKGE